MIDCDQIQIDKPVIDLSLIQVGVVILYPSGVIYHNQTCGVSCLQRCEEGVLLLPSDPLLVQSVPTQVYQCPIDAGLRRMTWLAKRGIDEKRASEIDDLLHQYGYTKGISIDRSRLKDSEEAWVYVDLEPIKNALYEGFGKCKGVLVWENSD